MDINTAVSGARLVGLANKEELLNLILSHSEYQLANKSKVSYDWLAIEQEARAKYLYSKYRVMLTREQLPIYTFKEDLNPVSKIVSLQSNQVGLSFWAIFLQR